MDSKLEKELRRFLECVKLKVASKLFNAQKKLQEKLLDCLVLASLYITEKLSKFQNYFLTEALSLFSGKNFVIFKVRNFWIALLFFFFETVTSNFQLKSWKDEVDKSWQPKTWQFEHQLARKCFDLSVFLNRTKLENLSIKVYETNEKKLFTKTCRKTLFSFQEKNEEKKMKKMLHLETCGPFLT